MNESPPVLQDFVPFRAAAQKPEYRPEFGPFCLDLGLSLDLGPKGDEALRVGQGGGTDGRTYGRTDGRTDRFPLCSTGLRPLRGRCPKSGKTSVLGAYVCWMPLPTRPQLYCDPTSRVSLCVC